jgi:hypothetical protein
MLSLKPFTANYKPAQWARIEQRGHGDSTAMRSHRDGDDTGI